MKKYYILFSIIIVLFTVYLLLDTFLISDVYESVENKEVALRDNYEVNDNYYKDENIEISINEVREYNTTIYIADVKLSSIDYLNRAFAKNSYGKNVTEKTSVIASNNNAILAINGDYYGVQESGYVLSNYKIYRSISSNRKDLVIYRDGSFGIIDESTTNINDLLNSNVKELLSFGPALIVDGEIVINEITEVGKSMSSNPRTAIGIIDDLHYVFVVSDGRTKNDDGVSLYELAKVMQEYGVKTLYNLDGGGSSTMYFNGKVINNPTTNGRISERSVSDIVYIG